MKEIIDLQDKTADPLFGIKGYNIIKASHLEPKKPCILDWDKRKPQGSRKTSLGKETFLDDVIRA